jgi:hypothetical protein
VISCISYEYLSGISNIYTKGPDKVSLAGSFFAKGEFEPSVIAYDNYPVIYPVYKIDISIRRDSYITRLIYLTFDIKKKLGVNTVQCRNTEGTPQEEKKDN